MNTSRHQQQDDRVKQHRTKNIFLVASGFAVGFMVSTAVILNHQILTEHLDDSRKLGAESSPWIAAASISKQMDASFGLRHENDVSFTSTSDIEPPNTSNTTTITTGKAEIDQSVMLQPSSSSSTKSTLHDTRILVAIAAFDFTQIPHLEEVLDGYHDIACAGAKVDLVIHATIAYPVTFIDMLNSRFTCDGFSMDIVLKQASLRLHLVDCHRQLFYDKIDEYDLFIYTEEDILVTPRTVATYLQETRRIQEILSQDSSSKYSFTDFNVGIVRYEYNFPSNVVIDDKTRHSIQNVTRVYWEHSSKPPPTIPNVLDGVPQGKALSDRYVGMANHHQGMFLATREHLLAWKGRNKCNFNVAKNRPGSSSQPSEGTQRVWMSSHQLYGKRHCNVQQVIPKEKFGALTVLHIPNKNYRRVGKYRKREFSDGTEVFEQPPNLLTAMQLHLAMRKQWPSASIVPYKGPVTMVDEVTGGKKQRTPLLERRMKEYNEYVKRGGVLSDYDFTRTLLIEDS